jgi:probable F420-dependent oxidoreductase
MRFSTGMPGLIHYPPAFTPEWQKKLGARDFQLIARKADELGYDAINIPEHIVMPDSLAAAMGTYFPHALTAMAFIAGATSTIRVNSCVIVLPYHNPVVLAKAVSTLDVMSGGRVMLTFGVGHAEDEFEALGIPFHHRGRIADEYVEALGVLWTEDAPSYRGQFVKFENVKFDPKPIQRPTPPIWFGGNSAAALRRVARYGTGWMPWLVTPDQLPLRLEELRQLPGYGEHGEVDVWFPPAPIRIREEDHTLTADRPHDRFSSAQEVIDAIGALRDMGVTWTAIPYPGSDESSLPEYLDRLAWGAETVMPLFQ